MMSKAKGKTEVFRRPPGCHPAARHPFAVFGDIPVTED
jgi:hypothetical protein